VDAQELALTSPVSWTINEDQLNSGNANFDEKTGIKGPVSVMAVSQYACKDETPQASDKKNEPIQESSGQQASTPPDKAKLDEAPSSDQAGSKLRKARIVVFGSSLLASNKFYKLQGNGDLFMNTVSWLAEDENLIAIRPKSLRSQPIVLTASESSFIFLIPVLLVPLAWIIAGIVVHVYRRRAVKA